MASELHFINKMLNFIKRYCNNLKTMSVMSSETFVALAAYNTLAEAEIANSILQSANIWGDIRNEHMSVLNSIGGAATIVVRSEDLEAARCALEMR